LIECGFFVILISQVQQADFILSNNSYIDQV